MSKFWQHVEERLISRKGSIYYMGGTLVVDFERGGCVGMNLNGKGFVCPSKPFEFFKNDIVYLPESIKSLVQSIYLEIKGKTDHFKEQVELA